MTHAVLVLRVQYLENLDIFYSRISCTTKSVGQKCELVEDVWRLMQHFAKHVVQDCFKRSWTVVTNRSMISSFSQLLHQVACLHPCKVQ